MWRNVSWNSTEPARLPEGMHKHETGAYFKTPSIQSGTSSQSGGGGTAGQLPASATTTLAATNHSNSTESIGPAGGQSITPTEEITEEPSMNSEPVTTTTAPPPSQPPTSTTIIGRKHQQQRIVPEQTAESKRGRRLKESGRQMSAAAGKSSYTNNNNNTATNIGSNRQLSAAAGAANSGSNATGSSSTTHHPGFRSRLSSISGALQHPRLAKRLFSHHQDSISEQQHQANIQITTTSIDSPQHHQAAGGSSGGHHQDSADNQSGGGGSGSGRIGGGVGWAEQLEPRLMSSSSGRRLSQLFLPQLPNNPMLSQDPYASNELFPPHLLGLYGQPPLVGGSASPASAALSAQRASWADISLLGRLSNVRPSIDSAFHSGQVRHSFDARK